VASVSQSNPFYNDEEKIKVFVEMHKALKKRKRIK
jgi:hypothetical protein